MRHISLTATVALCAVSLLSAAGTSPAQRAEDRPTPATTTVAPTGIPLPAAIAASFKKAYPTATVQHVSKEKDAGKDVYEVESLDGDLGRDLVYRPDGTVVEVEEELRPAELPAAIASAIASRYPRATVAKRERLTRGTVVSYEVQLEGADVAEVSLTPTAEWISPAPVR